MPGATDALRVWNRQVEKLEGNLMEKPFSLRQRIDPTKVTIRIPIQYAEASNKFTSGG